MKTDRRIRVRLRFDYPITLTQRLVVLHTVELAHGFNGRLVGAGSSRDAYFIDLQFLNAQQARAFCSTVAPSLSRTAIL